MEILVKMPSCNRRRYGSVWALRVLAWPVGEKATFGPFGNNTDYDTVEINASPGDVIYYGRRDHRGGKSEWHYLVVEAGGALRDICASEARRLVRGDTTGGN